MSCNDAGDIGVERQNVHGFAGVGLFDVAGNGDVVAGFYLGLASRDPAAVDAFKRAAIKSPIFARLVPYITLAIGLTAGDVDLVRGGLATGVLPSGSLQGWGAGGELAKLPQETVAPLFSDLLGGGAEPWNVAMNLIGMYVHGDDSRLDKLRPQVRQLAETAGIRGVRRDVMSNHHFQQVMTWMLGHGRDDEDARAVALSLTRILVAQAEQDGLIGDHRITPLIPTLLTDFPEMVWSLISNAIVADPKSAWRFEFALTERGAGNSGKTSALLNLPPDTLFAWCHTHLEVGPAFLAVTIPLLGPVDATGVQQLHPIIQRLLDEFGERVDVQNAIGRNIHTFGWSGSTADYYRKFLGPFSVLTDHSKAPLRRWAKKVVDGLKKQIEQDKRDDDEQDAFWGN